MIYPSLGISVQTLALIVIVISAIKILVLLIKPKAWIDFAGSLYKMPAVSMAVFAVLAYLVLSVLMNAGITYTQIFAVTLFVVLLSGLTLSIYAKDFMGLAHKLVKDRNFWNKAWFPTLVWVALAVLALNEMYGFF